MRRILIPTPARFAGQEWRAIPFDAGEAIALVCEAWRDRTGRAPVLPLSTWAPRWEPDAADEDGSALWLDASAVRAELRAAGIPAITVPARRAPLPRPLNPSAPEVSRDPLP